MTRKEAERLTRQADTLRALGFTREECEQLRRISVALQRWHELECGDSNEYGSWCVVRGRKVGGVFAHDDDGKPFMEHHHYRHGRGQDSVTYTPLADREAGARRRLKAIIDRVNLHERHGDLPDGSGADRAGVLSAYVQTDPRGAALYILRPGDVPEGQDAESYYTRGICVY